MAQLIEAQRSLRRVLLGAVYQEGSTSPAASGAVKVALRAAWTLLTTIDQDQPETLDGVLGHPYVRVWAVRCLQQLRLASAGHAAGDAGEDHAGDARGLAADLGHLGAISAVAAVRAGVSAHVTVPLIDGAVHLPTLGRLAAGPAEAAGPVGPEPGGATVGITGGAVSIQIGESCWTLAIADPQSGELSAVALAGDGRSADWQPVRMLRAPGISVALDDTDPYRDCHQWRAGPRLTDSEFAQWQRRFEDAWQEIEREHAAYAPALAAGLTTLMPLAATQEGRDVSATARHAFGAVAAALPADPATLALLLIHEFQHVKLGAVLDLYDLYDPSDDRLYHAPWRDDNRPLEGLLQGTYAHLAVTDFWRTRQNIMAGQEAEAAGQRFVHWRAHTRDAIETLASSGSLTPLGAWFVDEMSHSVGL
jgi:uncharacterized protein